MTTTRRRRRAVVEEGRGRRVSPRPRARQGRDADGTPRGEAHRPGRVGGAGGEVPSALRHHSRSCAQPTDRGHEVHSKGELKFIDQLKGDAIKC